MENQQFINLFFGVGLMQQSGDLAALKDFNI
jgi:hypothetical protein